MAAIIRSLFLSVWSMIIWCCAIAGLMLLMVAAWAGVMVTFHDAHDEWHREKDNALRRATWPRP